MSSSLLSRRSLFKALGVGAGMVACPSLLSSFLEPARAIPEASQPTATYNLSDPEVIRAWEQMLKHEIRRGDPLFDPS